MTRHTKIIWVCDSCSSKEEMTSLPPRWQRYMISNLDAKGKVLNPNELSICGKCVDATVDQSPVGFFKAFINKIKGK